MAYIGKTNWQNNEIVEASALNRIEQGVIDNDAALQNKADKKVPAATGNVATLDATGNLADGGKTVAGMIAEAQAGLVPTSRTVNGKALSSNISLTASDVVALPSTGGTLTGNLEVSPSGTTAFIRLKQPGGTNPSCLLQKDYSGGADNGTYLQDLADDGTYALLSVRKQASAGNPAESVILSYNGQAIYKLYGEHNKPTATDVGAAASSHNQAASTITAGTLAGKVRANTTAAATLGDPQVRDIYASTVDITAGSTALTTGVLYFVYE